MTFPASNLFLYAVLLACAGGVHAADTSPATPAADDPLTPARAQIAAKNWTGAIDELKRVNATTSADWNNLMGYSHRKAKTPDYAAAEKFYDEALKQQAPLYNRFFTGPEGGRFVLPDVAPGTYTADIILSGWEVVKMPQFTVRAKGIVENVELQLRPKK